MSTISEQYSENYKMFRTIKTQFESMQSLDDYKKFVINWRETLKILTERQKAYKKEIRKPHEVTEVVTTWGKYYTSGAREYQSAVISTKSILHQMNELRVLSKLEYHTKYKQPVS
jgi:hypothetical protein